MCSFISLKSDLFKRVFFFYAGKCFAERAPPFCSGSAAFTFRAFTMALHATSRPQPGPRGGVAWLLPPVQWHLPVPSSPTPPQLSAGLSPCRHVASALSQQGSCLWCGRARALSAVPFLWCWITLGPARSLH